MIKESSQMVSFRAQDLDSFRSSRRIPPHIGSTGCIHAPQRFQQGRIGFQPTAARSVLRIVACVGSGFARRRRRRGTHLGGGGCASEGACGGQPPTTNSQQRIIFGHGFEQQQCLPRRRRRRRMIGIMLMVIGKNGSKIQSQPL